jgi:probable addiction module antidote protein
MRVFSVAKLKGGFRQGGYFSRLLGHIARAKGMSQLSRDTGLGRESLYKALSGEGNPSFATILKVTSALGIRLHALPAQNT